MKYMNKFIVLGLGFALTFTGTSLVHGMFTSSYRQENLITISPLTIEVLLDKKAYFYYKEQGRFKDLLIPIKISGDYEISDLDIEATLPVESSVTKTFKYSIEKRTIDKVTLDYLVISSTDGYPFDTKEQCKLELLIKIKNTEHELLRGTYIIPKNNNGGNDYQETDFIPVVFKNYKEGSSSEVVEPPKEEEIEVPNKPEVIEQPKEEEVEVPNKPEVVNPPKEEEIEVPNKPEVVEPPKEEEIEVPNKPEVIEPPKENEELQ